MERKQLVKTATELNKVLELDPAIVVTKKATDEEIIQGITEAADLLEDEDKLTKATEATLDAIFEEGTEEGTEETTADLVAAADSKALKQMAKDYPEFKGIKTVAVKTEVLREKMLAALEEGGEAPVEKEVVKPEAKKKPTAKKKKEGGTKVTGHSLAADLLESKASEKEITAAYTKFYADKDINDDAFIEKRAKIYMNLAKKDQA